jgi:cell wall-associated NlpC family hydrolase
MSFSDAVGQIDQIVQWEQQLANPATASQAATTSGTTTESDSSSETSASSFAATLAEAQASTEASAATSLLDPTATSSSGSAASTDSTSDLLGGGDSQLLTALQSMEASTATSTASSTTAGSAATDAATAADSAAVTDTANSGASGGQATSSSDPRILAMTEEANALVGKPYLWGGGHSGWGSSKGYDCSGFVSAVLHAGGYLSTPQDTATLPSAGGMEQGPGQYVTIYDRDTPGETGHVIISINGQFYESGGEHGTWGGGGGVQEISTPSASYLATFNDVIHPAGL